MSTRFTEPLCFGGGMVIAMCSSGLIIPTQHPELICAVPTTRGCLNLFLALTATLQLPICSRRN